LVSYYIHEGLKGKETGIESGKEETSIKIKGEWAGEALLALWYA
jgi:hypothetical protein